MKKLFLLVLMIVCFTGSAIQQEDSAQAWRDDLAYMIERMERIHPDLYWRYPKEEWDALVQTLHGNIPTMTDDQIIVELIKIAAKTDGHSGIFPYQEVIGWHTYPLTVYWFSDGLYVVNAGSAYREAIGQKVISIGRMTAAEAYEVLKPLVAHDNEYGVKAYVPIYYVIPEVLLALGVIEDMAQPEYVLENAGGEQTVLNPSYETLGDSMMYLHMNNGLPQHPEPLYLSRHHEENFWYTFLEDSGTLYIQHNFTYGTTNSGLTMSGMSRQLEEFIAENEVERLVLDLRHNPGGNNRTYKPLLFMLRNNQQINQRGRLFVITGRVTFSAAADFVMELMNDTEAIFAGEPMGTGPNHYGENAEFRLPNSNIEVSISTQLWAWNDLSDTRTLLKPDIRVDLSSEDYFNRRDPVLEAILALDDAA